MRIISSQDLFESYMSDLDEAAVRVSKKVRGAKPSAAEWQRSRSYAGKRISGDQNSGPRYYTLGRSRGAEVDAPTLPGQRPVNTPKVTKSELQYARTEYNSNKKRLSDEFELWVNSLVNEGYDLSEYTWEDVYEIYESYSDYLTIQAFLIGEGYADSIQESDYMIENMDEDLIEEILEEGYKKLPVDKMIMQAAKKGERFSQNWHTTDDLLKTQKQLKKMARVAKRHSTIKGKGKIRGEGQAMLNRIRGENR